MIHLFIHFLPACVSWMNSPVFLDPATPIWSEITKVITVFPELSRNVYCDNGNAAKKKKFTLNHKCELHDIREQMGKSSMSSGIYYPKAINVCLQFTQLFPYYTLLYILGYVHTPSMCCYALLLPISLCLEIVFVFIVASVFCFVLSLYALISYSRKGLWDENYVISLCSCFFLFNVCSCLISLNEFDL